MTLEERIEALDLSPLQRDLVLREGDFFLNACPGSGKTRVVGLRAARLSLEGAPVAVTTYTNVAAQEVREAALPLGTFSEDVFVDTVHAFLMRFVFAPFGHIVMGCTQRPIVPSEPMRNAMSADDTTIFFSTTNRPHVWGFGRRLDGSLYSSHTREQRGHVTADALCAGVRVDHLAAKKTALFRRGFASEGDAMEIALEVLRTRPDIASAVAARFDEIIIDEVQDTSDTQLACFRELRGARSDLSLVASGDLGQGIYSFNGTSPSVCATELIDTWQLDVVSLSENWRSTQAICDVTSHFTSQRATDVAVGSHAADGPAPELLRYSGDPSDLVPLFCARLDVHGLPHVGRLLFRRANAAARASGAVHGIRSPLLRDLALARKALDDGTGAADTVVAVESRLWSLLFPNDHLADADHDARLLMRGCVIRCIESLPTLTTDLATWTSQARTVVREAVMPVGTVTATVMGQRTRLGSSEPRDTAVAALVAGDRHPTIDAATVHKSKGMSIDAVVLAALPSQSDRDVSEWTRSPGLDPDSEEARVAYVALTRARYYLAVALPHSASAASVEALTSRGFNQIQPHAD